MVAYLLDNGAKCAEKVDIDPLSQKQNTNYPLWENCSNLANCHIAHWLILNNWNVRVVSLKLDGMLLAAHITTRGMTWSCQISILKHVSNLGSNGMRFSLTYLSPWEASFFCSYHFPGLQIFRSLVKINCSQSYPKFWSSSPCTLSKLEKVSYHLVVLCRLLTVRGAYMELSMRKWGISWEMLDSKGLV